MSAAQEYARGWHSSATVRSLAAELGLSKDTVARALTRLSAAAIAVADEDRAPAGTIATGRYRIAVPDGIALVQPVPPTPATTRPRATRLTGSQLALTLDG